MHSSTSPRASLTSGIHDKCDGDVALVECDNSEAWKPFTTAASRAAAAHVSIKGFIGPWRVVISDARKTRTCKRGGSSEKAGKEEETEAFLEEDAADGLAGWEGFDDEDEV